MVSLGSFLIKIIVMLKALLRTLQEEQWLFTPNPSTPRAQVKICLHYYPGEDNSFFHMDLLILIASISTCCQLKARLTDREKGTGLCQGPQTRDGCSWIPGNSM